MKYLGIDFGTIWTKAAIYDTDTKDVALVNMDDGAAAHTEFELYGGNYACPTAVFYDKDSNTSYVGKKAFRNRNSDPSHYHDKFKPLLTGSGAHKWENDVTEVLKYVLSNAIKTANTSKFDKVVLTVPSSTIKNDIRWNTMMTAAKRAGIDGSLIEIIREPEAAGYYLISQTINPSSYNKFLVYDLGGGTFDPALLQYVNGTLRVVGEWDSSIPRGKSIGGIYIDDKIREDILEKDQLQEIPYFQEMFDDISAIPMDEYNRPILNDRGTILKYRKAMRDVDMFTQLPIKAKHHLSEATKQYFHERLSDYQLSLEEFDEMIEPLVDDTIQSCDTLLSDYGWEWNDLKSVFLVGGSSVIKLIRKKIEMKKMIEHAQFIIPDQNSYDIIHAVARGAALYESMKPTYKQRLEFGKQALARGEFDEAEFQFREGNNYWNIGIMEYAGLGRKKSYRNAWQRFNTQFTDGSVFLEDLFMRALMLFRGEGIRKDDEAAISIIDRVEHGNYKTSQETPPRDEVVKRIIMIRDVINGTADETTINKVYSTDFFKF